MCMVGLYLAEDFGDALFSYAQKLESLEQREQ